MLDFETNSEYIKGVFEFNADFATGGGASVRLQIFFNDIMVMQERDVSSDWNTGDNEFRFIIPPFTHVVANVLGGSQDANVNFTGRVYEHLPVRN